MGKTNFEGVSRADSAIPTEFGGVMYRSKTEARWAVFFNRLGVKFTYEERVFELPDGRRYTPDFFVEDFNAVIEVKPDNEAIVLSEADKIVLLHQSDKSFKAWLAIGPPDAKQNNIIDLSIVDKWGEWIEKQHTIEGFWNAKEIRSQILEDRRDPFLYWFGGPEENPYGYAIGGPGKSTDHLREPMLHWNVEAAYSTAKKAFKGKKAGPTAWKGDPERLAQIMVERSWKK